MGNFELIFSLEAKRKEGKEWVMGDGGIIKRVIVVNDEEIAEKIGLAMIGEEVFPLQYINALLSVNPTDNHPHLDSFSADYTWSRALARLGLQRSEVRFTYRTKSGGDSDAVSGGRIVRIRTESVVEEVGVELSFNQRQHVLSLIL